MSSDQSELLSLFSWVALEPVWEGAYYIDGHFSPYSGGRPVPKAWNAKRRLVDPGQTDLYVHDASGRVLFFMRPFNDQLVKGIPQLLTEIRAVAPRDPPIVLVFDRGGYSGPLFRALTREGIGFITYLKGRAARRRFPARHFRRRWWHVEDPATIQRPRRVVYRIHEKRTRIRGAGLVRTLVVADEDAQVPVLTNCRTMGAAKVVHLLDALAKKTASSICRHTTASSSSFNTTRPGTGTTGSWRILAAPRCGSRSRHCRPTSC